MHNNVHLLRKLHSASLILRICLGLAAGIILGIVLPGWKWIGILGTLFVHALRAIAPILVAVLIISAISKASQDYGPRFRTVIHLYLISTFTAALIAVLGSWLFPVQLELQQSALTGTGSCRRETSHHQPQSMSVGISVSLTNRSCLGWVLPGSLLT